MCIRDRDISHRRSARGVEILLLAPGWTSLVVVRRVVGRFSYSPQAGHLSSSFGACWGDSLTRPGLDISGRRSARGGEILLLAPGWTSLVVVRRGMGRFYYSPQARYLWSSFGAWWGNSLTRPRLDISRHPSTRHGEILLLALGWTSLVIDRHVVGRFSYSPQAGLSGYCSARGGKIFLLAPDWTSLVVVRRVVGRFSYSPQA